MSSIREGYIYDIHLHLSCGGQVFISYRQKDKKLKFHPEAAKKAVGGQKK